MCRRLVVVAAQIYILHTREAFEKPSTVSYQHDSSIALPCLANPKVIELTN